MTTEQGVLEGVAELARRQRQGEQQLREAVRAARAAGQSWTAIAAQLGVTRQSARERFMGVDAGRHTWRGTEPGWLECVNCGAGRHEEDGEFSPVCAP